MSVKMTIQGLDIVKKKMRSMMKELRSSPEGMTKISYLAIRDVIQHFNDGVGPGYQWQPSQRALRQSGKTLIDTGLLRNANRYQIQGNSVLIFNNVYYGKYHQDSKTLKREFMWISQSAWQKIYKAYLDQIMGAYSGLS